MRYNRISADCHLDLIWLPPDLFVSEAPAALKDRMPYVAEGPEGPRWIANNGATFGLAGGVGASGTKHVPGKQLRVDVMAATGLYEDGKKGIRRPGDPHLRVKEMDRDGVDAEVIYGILAAAAKLNDREASTEMLRIYNTWLSDFCRHYPDRHIDRMGFEAVLEKAIAEALDGPKYIYLSLDIDVLDPAYAPGTGTPEPGGLTPRELLPAIRRLCHETPVVGFEVVEVAPHLDPGYTTALYARRAILEALTGLAQRKLGLKGPNYLDPMMSGQVPF
jgi:hypothetical protein